MPRKRVTSQQVADRAGVSRTTVSLVLNRVEGIHISEATRQRVLAASRELGYVPNEAARSLARGKTHTLAFIICQAANRIISDAYLPQVIHGANTVTQTHGFRILVDWVEDVSQPDAYVNLARAKKIDGILLSCPRLDDNQLADLVAEGFPVVLLGDLPQTKACSVDCDNRAAAMTGVQHLIAQGHTQIACITNAPAHYQNANDRLLGYRQQLEAADIAYRESWVRYGNFDPESGYRAMCDLLALQDRPEAVFIASDVVAFGALAAIRDHDLRIPEDIAIVSFDDVPLARYVSPPLTTVRVPAVEQGRLAGTVLTDLIRGQHPTNRRMILNTELIVRRSCGSALDNALQ